VFASISGVNSSAQPLTVCPITQLSYKNATTNDTAPFTIAKAATQTMNVVAIDSAGVTLTNPPVNYVSGNVYGMTAAPSTTASAGVMTAANSGTSAFTYAECAPPTCNKNLTPIFSQGIVGTVSGAYNAPTIYAASTKSLNLIPFDTATSTAGATITLPYLPNSFLMNHQGTKAVLGSDSNPTMILDVTAGTVSTFATITGAKVLSISPDGNFALISNSTGTFVINMATSPATSTVNTATGVAIQGQFSPDSRFAYFTTGGPTLFVLDLNSAVTLTYPQGSNFVDVSVLANGSLVYLATAGAIKATPTCDLQNGGIVDSQAVTSPTTMATLPNGAGVVAIDGTTLKYVHNTATTQACPPAVTESTIPIPLNLSSGTPKQLIVDYAGNQAVVTGTGNQLSVVTLTAGTSKAVTLGASANVSGIGDVSADSAFFYIGGTDNTIHKIDLGSGTDASQIAIALKDANAATVAPDLVAVRNK